MRSSTRALLAVALGVPASAGWAQAPQVDVYAFSLLTADSSGSPAAYARVVITDPAADCPTLSASEGPSLAMSPRHNPAPDEFPITVCEAAMEFGTIYTLPAGQQQIAPVAMNPSRILVYGDTGCDAKKECVKASVWPFPTLAGNGAALAPDLILHMGDYNYRGTPGSVEVAGSKLEVYDAGDHYPTDPNCSLMSPYYSENASDNLQPADTWTSWQLDFFAPAATLLPKAPWVFTRGNHELCSRAGIGWFYLLDAGSDLPGAATPQRQCPSQGSLADPDTDVLSHVLFIEPYVVDLGNLRVAVVDSAGACDNFAPAATTTIYSLEFDLLDQLLRAKDSPTWLMTHRPLWGITDGSTAGSVQWINQTLQQAVAQSGARELPPSVGLSLSGHMHLYESSVSTDGSRPPQIIIGNSGVSLAKHEYGDCFELFDSSGDTGADFGFLSAEIGAQDGWSSWTGEILAPDSSTVALCGPAVQGGICVRPSKPCD